MFQLLNDSSFVFLPINNYFSTTKTTTNLMENVQKSPRTSPTKISEIENDKAHELKIFKTSKPIKDSPDDRALTSKKSKNNKEEKHGFFHKFGFGSKSASVSPVKNIISIPRRSSEINDETKSRKNIQRKNVEATKEKSSSKKSAIVEGQKHQQQTPKSKPKNNDKSKVTAAAIEVEVDDGNGNCNGSSKDVKVDDEDDKAISHSPISSYEDQSIAIEAADGETETALPETGTESDARVSQTIIMKKRTLHEAKTEAIFLPFGNISSSSSSVS